MNVEIQPVDRGRSMAALLGGVAATNTSMVGASTAATLIGAHRLTEAWSGVPNAAGVLGTAAGTLGLSAVLARQGSRRALSLGYLVAVGGAAVAAFGVVTASITWLIMGMVLLGVGNGGAQLSRYCAADLYPPQRRGTAVGITVWAGTFGAIVGPNLLEPAAVLAGRFDLPDLAGPFLIAVLAAVAGLVASLSLPKLRVRARGGAAVAGGRAVWRQPAVLVALVSMICGQLAMVALMTMTPVHMTGHDHGLGAVGVVLSSHMIGMFALAPLSGHLADRYGARVAVLAGVAVLTASVLAASVPRGNGLTHLVIALFLLGWGWNLSFVGGSALLTQALTPQERLSVQGGVDALVWGTSALASVGAGLVLAYGSYGTLAVVAGVAALVPLPLVLRRSRPGEPDLVPVVDSPAGTSAR